MAYRRRRGYRRYFRSKRKSVSWTKETLQIMSGFSNTASADQPAYSISLPIVSNSGTQGGLNIQNSVALRTVKNFVVNGAFIYDTTQVADPTNPNQPDQPNSRAVSDDFSNWVQTQVPISWALIYCPQGVAKPYLSNGNYASLYEPNQNVIDSGVWMPSAGPLRIKSRMARKLHTGDQIYFCAYQWSRVSNGGVNPTSPFRPSLLTTISFCTKCN